MSFFKICTFCIKSHVWGREEFLWVAPPDSNAAKLRNECFSLFMLASLYKVRADTLPGEAKQCKKFRYVNCDFWDKRANLENYIASNTAIESKTPSSKLTILVSSYWKKNFIRNNVHKFFHSVPRFLEIIDRKSCIHSGPPCISYKQIYSVQSE